MNFRDVERRLRQDGFEPREGRGKRVYKHPDGRRVCIARSAPRSRNIPKGTLRAIFRQAGWNWTRRAA